MLGAPRQVYLERGCCKATSLQDLNVVSEGYCLAPAEVSIFAAASFTDHAFYDIPIGRITSEQ